MPRKSQISMKVERKLIWYLPDRVWGWDPNKSRAVAAFGWAWICQDVRDPAADTQRGTCRCLPRPPPPACGNKEQGCFHSFIQQISIECFVGKNLGLPISKEMVLALIFIGDDGSKSGNRLILISDICTKEKRTEERRQGRQSPVGVIKKAFTN